MLKTPHTYTGNAFADVDFDRPGRQLGFIRIPHSPHGDAWGVTQVPIAVIANGKGRLSSSKAATMVTSMKGRSSSRNWRASSIRARSRAG
jgi:hypothetical protein